jgi:hypothetical protein
LPLGKELVSILYDLEYQLRFPGDVGQVVAHLMRSTNQVHIVLLQEPRNDIRAESERYTSVILRPACDVLVGIGPEEIAEKA